MIIDKFVEISIPQRQGRWHLFLALQLPPSPPSPGKLAAASICPRRRPHHRFPHCHRCREAHLTRAAKQPTGSRTTEEAPPPRAPGHGARDARGRGGGLPGRWGATARRRRRRSASRSVEGRAWEGSQYPRRSGGGGGWRGRACRSVRRWRPWRARGEAWPGPSSASF
jgi:hypothetical protein